MPPTSVPPTFPNFLEETQSDASCLLSWVLVTPPRRGGLESNQMADPWAQTGSTQMANTGLIANSCTWGATKICYQPCLGHVLPITASFVTPHGQNRHVAPAYKATKAAIPVRHQRLTRVTDRRKRLLIRIRFRRIWFTASP